MNFVCRERLLPQISQIYSIRIHPVSQGLTACLCKRGIAFLHFNCNCLNFTRQVAAYISYAKHIYSAVPQTFINDSFEAMKMFAHPSLNNWVQVSLSNLLRHTHSLRRPSINL